LVLDILSTFVLLIFENNNTLLVNKTILCMQPVSRRDWLRLSGLALASLSLQQKLSATDSFLAEQPFMPLPGNPMARLSSNENPYGPSERVKKAIIDKMDVVCRYPFSYQDELLQAIADWEGVSKDQ
jgi:histidinol-phosphate aminotransferase